MQHDTNQTQQQNKTRQPQVKTNGELMEDWEEIISSNASWNADYLNKKEREDEREGRGKREKKLQLYYWLFPILFFTGIAFNSIFSSSDAHWNAYHDDGQA